MIYVILAGPKLTCRDPQICTGGVVSCTNLLGSQRTGALSGRHGRVRATRRRTSQRLSSASSEDVFIEPSCIASLRALSALVAQQQRGAIVLDRLAPSHRAAERYTILCNVCAFDISLDKLPSSAKHAPSNRPSSHRLSVPAPRHSGSTKSPLERLDRLRPGFFRTLVSAKIGTIGEQL